MRMQICEMRYVENIYFFKSLKRHWNQVKIATLKKQTHISNKHAPSRTLYSMSGFTHEYCIQYFGKKQRKSEFVKCIMFMSFIFSNPSKGFVIG